MKFIAVQKKILRKFLVYKKPSQPGRKFLMLYTTYLVVNQTKRDLYSSSPQYNSRTRFAYIKEMFSVTWNRPMALGQAKHEAALNQNNNKSEEFSGGNRKYAIEMLKLFREIFAQLISETAKHWKRRKARNVPMTSNPNIYYIERNCLRGKV